MSERSTSPTSDTSSDAGQVETLIAGRSKRATAGNKYNREILVAEAEADAVDNDDVVQNLFKDLEGEDDEEFEEAEVEDDDAAFGSSSDDEDQGPNAAPEDLEGEKELQTQAKAERAKKRKAQLQLTSVHKKVRIDPRTSTRPASEARPSKKKERVFLPNRDAHRISLREQTRANTEIIKAKLVQDEKVRLKHKARREKRDREREQERSRVITQADRLAEAARIERKNAKSLNRWEAIERKRADEQAAKLAALKNRKLEGPVISLWSGVAKWIGPRVDLIDAAELIQDVGAEVKKRGRKPKAYHEQMAAATRQKEQEQNVDEQFKVPPPAIRAAPSATASHPLNIEPLAVEASSQTIIADLQVPTDFLSGIHEYASMQNENLPDLPLQDSSHHTGEIPTTPVQIVDAEPRPAAVLEAEAPPGADQATVTSHKEEVVHREPSPPPTIEYATRNLVGLERFDELPPSQRNHYLVFFHSRKSAKPTKHIAQLCPITAVPARYRDPSTGIAYANKHAYRKLQELKRHEHAWSSMLGCYVGRVGLVARGVPEGFLG